MPDAHGAKIFISYRRDDAGAKAGRLSDDLQRAFGDDSVFLDVVGIQLGRDFRKAIHQNVGGCGVLLAVIGPQWATIKGPDGTKRLTNANDYVRLEIATALQRDIPVIPVLVRGATLPPPEALPGDLQEMVYRNSVELTHTRWHSDVALLTTALKQLVADQAAEEETKRQAAEQEREAEAGRQQELEHRLKKKEEEERKANELEQFRLKQVAVREAEAARLRKVEEREAAERHAYEAEQLRRKEAAAARAREQEIAHAHLQEAATLMQIETDRVEDFVEPESSTEHATPPLNVSRQTFNVTSDKLELKSASGNSGQARYSPVTRPSENPVFSSATTSEASPRRITPITIIFGITLAVSLLSLLYIAERPTAGSLTEDARTAYSRGSFTQAAKLWKRACNLGEMESCNALAERYEDGRGVQQNLQTAVSLFQQACSGNWSDSCFAAAQIYARGGSGFTPDIGKAASLYRQACDGGVAAGCDALGLMYANGTGVAKDMNTAGNLFEKACKDHNDPVGCTYYNFLSYYEGNFTDDLQRIVDIYTGQCVTNNAQACNFLGNMYSTGTGVTKNLQESAKLWDRACGTHGAGVENSCISLGNLYHVLYMYGYDADWPLDDAKAKAYFERACTLNTQSPACAFLKAHF